MQIKFFYTTAMLCHELFGVVSAASGFSLHQSMQVCASMKSTGENSITGSSLQNEGVSL